MVNNTTVHHSEETIQQQTINQLIDNYHVNGNNLAYAELFRRLSNPMSSSQEKRAAKEKIQKIVQTNHQKQPRIKLLTSLIEAMGIGENVLGEHANNLAQQVTDSETASMTDKSNANTVLGYLSLKGLVSGEKSYEQALEHFQKAAEHNNIIALTYLGDLELNNEEPILNFETAYYYYQAAANLGGVEAKERLEPFKLVGMNLPFEQSMKNIKQNIQYYQMNPSDKVTDDLTLAFKILLDKALQTNQLHDLINDFVSNPHQWVISIDGLGGKFNILLPGLSECACINSDNFNRLKNNRRSQIENNIVADLKQTFTNQNRRIHYMSFGTGGGLQDFVIIMRMLAEGYRNIRISLVDPGLRNYLYKNRFVTHHSSENGSTRFEKRMSYEDYIKIINNEDKHVSPEEVEWDEAGHLKVLKQLIQMIQHALNASVELQDYRNIQEFAKEQDKADIITAIDFDDFQEAFDDIMEAHNHLSDRGRMYLSYGLNDFTFNSKECVSCPNDIKENPIAELSDQNKENKRQLKIGSLTTTIYFNSLYKYVIPYINAHKNLESVQLNLIRPQETNFFGVPRGPNHSNKNISEASLAHYLKLLTTKANLNLSVNFADEEENIDNLLEQYSEDQDFICAYGYVIQPNQDETAEIVVEKIHN